MIAHPDEARAGLAGVLLLGGPILYLVAQAIYLRMTTGHDWLPRVAGAIVFGLGAAAAYWLPSMVLVALLVAVLLALAVHLSRERETADADVTSISEP